GEDTRAVKLLRAAVERSPGNFWYLLHLGAYLTDTLRPPNHEEALRCFTAVVAIRPRDAGAFLNMGNALRRLGRLDEAVACYGKAVALQPSYVAAHYNMGAVLILQKKYAESRECFRTLLAIRAGEVSARGGLATHLAAEGKWEEAVALWREL